MCEFCSFDEDGWAVSKEKQLNLGVLGKTTLGLDFTKKAIYASLCSNETPLSGEVKVKVNYCPMCGRKLVEE